jgi:sortase B
MNKLKKPSKRTIIILSIIISIVLISIGTVLLIRYFKDRVNNDGNNNIGVEVLIGDTEAKVTDSVDENRNLQNEIKALNATYNDAIGWLKVPGTSIDTPIFKSTDNDRYLRHDRDNKSTKWGEKFLDYRCDINNMDNMSHFIIYGHNTKSDDNFTPLLNYKNEQFLKDHGIIEFSTINGNYRWQIFSVYVTTTDFFYIDTSFADANEYTQFLYTLEQKSMYDTGVELLGNETILTLSTCDYSQKNGRFVVEAKLLK